MTSGIGATVIFWVLALFILGFGLAVVRARNLFKAAISLAFCLFGVAGIFLLLEAEFLAGVQVLLYIGAVTTLTIFAIMVTQGIADPAVKQLNEQQLPAAIVAGTAVLAVGLGAAAFSRSLVGRLTVWRDSSAERQEREREIMRDALLPEVSRRRQELLEYRVGPFLQSLIDTETLTPTDVQRARGLATAIRKDMVSDANRTWLSDVVDQLDDASHEVDRMTRDQRTALGGLIAELRGLHSLVPGSITASVQPGTPVTVNLSARLTGRKRLRPDAYRAVLRTYFPGAAVTSTLEGIDVTVSLAE